jgi:DNA repair exonuclease SbcCD ATPase subunit
LAADGLTEEEKEFLRERWQAIQESVEESGESLQTLEETMTEVFGETYDAGSSAALGISSSFAQMLEDLPLGDIEGLFTTIEAKRQAYEDSIPDTTQVVNDMKVAATNAADEVQDLLYNETDGLLSDNTKTKMAELNTKIGEMKTAFEQVKTEVEELTEAYVRYLNMYSEARGFLSHYVAASTDGSGSIMNLDSYQANIGSTLKNV